MKQTPFYASGLRFSCRRCSACCRHESGFVFLSADDIKVLTKELNMETTGFIRTYCRWVKSEEKKENLSLKEKSNFDCIFWDYGCKVYNARPVQCRTFPFWQSLTAGNDTWEMASLGCPGINSGKLYDREEIDAFILLRAGQLLVEKNMKGGNINAC